MTARVSQEFLALVAIGVAIRGLLFYFGFHETFAQRVEVSTPVTSYRRVKEGIFLSKSGLSPYAGDVFHESPLMLAIFYPLSFLDEVYTYLLYLILDIATAYGIYNIASIWNVRSQLQAQREDKIEEKYFALSVEQRRKCSRADTPHFTVVSTLSPAVVAAIYFINPLSIFSCVGLATVQFTNFYVIFAIVCALNGLVPLCALLVALASLGSLGHALTLAPALYLLLKTHPQRINYNAVLFGFWIIVALASVIALCRIQAGNWDFIDESFGFAFFARDLTPNVGLFWYLFTEMFKEFEFFYLCVLQYFVFIFAAPLTIRLHLCLICCRTFIIFVRATNATRGDDDYCSRHPMLLLWVLIATASTWRAYPAIGDIALSVALMPLLLSALRDVTFIVVIIVSSLFLFFLAPLFWSLWIERGSGNANFYYALNLVLAMLQIHTIVDAIAAVLRRDHLRKHPPKK